MFDQGVGCLRRDSKPGSWTGSQATVSEEEEKVVVAGPGREVMGDGICFSKAK